MASTNGLNTFAGNTVGSEFGFCLKCPLNPRRLNSFAFGRGDSIFFCLSGGYGDFDKGHDDIFESISFVHDNQLSVEWEVADVVGFMEKVLDVRADEWGADGGELGEFVGATGDWMAPSAMHGVGGVLCAEETGGEGFTGLYTIAGIQIGEAFRRVESGVVRSAFEDY